MAERAPMRYPWDASVLASLASALAIDPWIADDSPAFQACPLELPRVRWPAHDSFSLSSSSQDFPPLWLATADLPRRTRIHPSETTEPRFGLTLPGSPASPRQ